MSAKNFALYIRQLNIYKEYEMKMVLAISQELEKSILGFIYVFFFLTYTENITNETYSANFQLKFRHK